MAIKHIILSFVETPRCCKLFYQTCEDLISTDLMQVDEKTCIKSANDNLQQA